MFKKIKYSDPNKVLKTVKVLERNARIEELKKNKKLQKFKKNLRLVNLIRKFEPNELLPELR